MFSSAFLTSVKIEIQKKLTIQKNLDFMYLLRSAF